MRCLAALGLAVVAIAGAAAPARAEDARIAAARAAYDELRQERVVKMLAPVLAGPLDDHDRASAQRLLGCAHMVLGERDAALAAFRDSFALEPDAALEPQLASPDARSLFEVARGEWRASLVTEMEKYAGDIAALRLGVRAPAVARGGEPVRIDVDVGDPTHLVARVELSYRRRGGTFTLLAQRPADGATPRGLAFEIPASATESAQPFALEYHVALRHQSGFDLRRDGDSDHPRIIEVSAGHRPRWYEQWWVRGVIAAGVVALGTGGYLAYRSIDVGGQRVVVGGGP